MGGEGAEHVDEPAGSAASPLVRRCREVSVAEVAAAVADGAASLHGVKVRTQAMTGLCQGRTCRRLIARMLAEQGPSVAELRPRRGRGPVRPCPLTALEAGEEP